MRKNGSFFVSNLAVRPLTFTTLKVDKQPLQFGKMTAPRHAWIQDAEVAKAVDNSNTIQRAHLCDRLIPFIQKIHQRNVTYPDEIIPLSDFIGNYVGNQLDYKIEKYKKDIAHPEVKFAASKLAERPDYMQHVDQEFIQRLSAAGRSISRESFHNLFDMQQGDQLHPAMRKNWESGR